MSMVRGIVKQREITDLKWPFRLVQSSLILFRFSSSRVTEFRVKLILVFLEPSLGRSWVHLAIFTQFQALYNQFDVFFKSPH